MKNFLLLFVAAIFLIGCGKNDVSNTDSSKASGDEPAKLNSTLNQASSDASKPIIQPKTSIKPDFVPSDLLDSEQYAKFKQSFEEFVELEYANLTGKEFVAVSKELINYRAALSDQKNLSSWLFASKIEDVISTKIVKKVGENELNLLSAHGLIKEYQDRFYSVDGIAKVFDDELSLKGSERFQASEREILKEKLRLKNPDTATVHHRYRALSEHISSSTGGLNNQVRIDWAENTYALVALLTRPLFKLHS